MPIEGAVLFELPVNELSLTIARLTVCENLYAHAHLLLKDRYCKHLKMYLIKQKQLNYQEQYQLLFASGNDVVFPQP